MDTAFISRFRLAPALVLLCCAAVAVAAEAPKEWDGLQLTPSKRIDRLYVRPGASLSGYKSVRLERLQVAFDKNWKPNDSRTLSTRLTKEDFDKIKNALADQFAKTFAAELARGGYKVVEEGGDDVLDVTPLIVDLYIAAPDKPTAGRSRTYTADAGRMTLVAELRDSDTGQILARALDAQSDRSGTFQVASSVSNMAAADRIISRWASQLRDALDEANKTLNPKH
jgi:Protein of unknown function (DUF3313)